MNTARWSPSRPGRRLLAVAAALATAVLGSMTGVAPTARAATPEDRILTVGITNDVDSLNPFVGLLVESYELWGLMYDSLTGYAAKDYGATPGLAESWTTSPDGTIWTYRIRSGVLWSDGVPLTAKDAAYTFNRVLKGTTEKTNYGSYVANIVSAVAPDDTTLVLTTKVPTPQMLHLSVPILPEHIWSKVSAKSVATFTNDPAGQIKPVGSGPFVLTERKAGQYLRLTANKNYWGGAPHLDGVEFRPFASPEALSQALRKGEIDFADSLEANIFEALTGQPGITTVSARYGAFDEIAFNQGAALADGTPIGDGHPALKDKRVRQAIAHAVDLDALVKRAIGGHGRPGGGVIPPMYTSLHYDPGADRYAFDLAKANQLLDDAGYRKGADGIRTMPDGTKPLALRLFARSESQGSKTTAQFVAEWLNQIGLKITVKTISEDQLTEAVATGEFDLFEWGWGVEPDPDYQLSTFTCEQRSYKEDGKILAGLSDSFYCNPAYDALYAQQKTQVDPAERAATVKQMQKMLYDDMGYLVTYYYDDLQAYRSDKFTGFVHQPDPDGVLLFQQGTHSYRAVMTVADAAAAKAAAASQAPAATATGSGGVSPTWVVLGVLGVLAGFGGGYGLGRRNRLLEDVRE
ncbi:MAG: ABC transporter substrate-binding protein [Kineosporiaceae bacterium]|nr:ABC transporter substrate-binding protein [Kineosporiaceae bacterium]